MRAAQEAVKTCKVILLADGGGASPYIHGINIPLAEEDSVACFMDDTLKSGRYQNQKPLVEKLCAESLGLKDEFPFDKTENGYALLKPLGSTHPRVAGIQGRTGVHILKEIEKTRQFEIFRHTRAMELLVIDGRVSGARCFDTRKGQWFTIAAKAVVLACGGFGRIFPFSTNSADIGGDGIAMAYQAGAELCDMEFIQFEPTVAVSPESIKGKSIITTMLYEGAVIRNKDGVRFMDEQVNKDVLSKRILQEIRKGGGTENGGVYFDMTAVGKEILLTKYHDYYKRYANVGVYITETPVEIAPGSHTTLGGVTINTNCETTVPGLFACGEVTGGLHGANRLGGNAGLEVLIFGKTTVICAAAYAQALKQTPVEIPAEGDTPFDDTLLRARLKAAVELGLNVIRNQTDSMSALNEVEQILQAVSGFENSFSAVRLRHDTLTAKIALSCAIERKESIGCHIRDDIVLQETQPYTLFVKQEKGQMKIEKRQCQ